MSNQLAGAEKMKSASVRVRADLLADFDDVVEESDRVVRVRAVRP